MRTLHYGLCQPLQTTSIALWCHSYPCTMIRHSYMLISRTVTSQHVVNLLAGYPTATRVCEGQIYIANNRELCL